MLRALVANFVGRDSSNTYRVDTDLGANFAQRSDSDFAWSRREGAVLDAEKQLHDFIIAHRRCTALALALASEIEHEALALRVGGIEEDAP